LNINGLSMQLTGFGHGHEPASISNAACHFSCGSPVFPDDLSSFYSRLPLHVSCHQELLTMSMRRANLAIQDFCPYNRCNMALGSVHSQQWCPNGATIRFKHSYSSFQATGCLFEHLRTFGNRHIREFVLR